MSATRLPAPAAPWDEAAESYELGLVSQRQIAAKLGVSPATVSRELKRRGATKGSRVQESVADLVAYLDRKQRRVAHMRAAAEHRAAQRRADTFAVLDAMMEAIMAADGVGDLTLADATIEHAGAAFGAPVRRRSKRRT